MNIQNKKTYIIRGVHEWILDSKMTPQIIITSILGSIKGIPVNFFNSTGVLTIDISSIATNDQLTIDDNITFPTLFYGQPSTACIPIECVIGIFAKETKEGTLFDCIDNSNPHLIFQEQSNPILKIVS